jgi:hypothetical protein
MKMYDGGYFHTFSHWSSHLSQWVSHDVPHHFPNARWCPSEQNCEVGAFITPISRTGFCHRFISTQRSGKNNKLKKKTSHWQAFPPKKCSHMIPISASPCRKSHLALRKLAIRAGVHAAGFIHEVTASSVESAKPREKTEVEFLGKS